MSAALSPRKFGFDTHFDEQGRVVASTPVARTKRAYLAAEVEAIRDKAFAEGQAAQREADESLKARSLAEIAQACAQALPVLDRVVAAYRAQAAELAVATGEAIASAALTRFPRAPIAAALEQLSTEIGSTARLVVRAGGADAGTVAEIERAAAEAGFEGRLVVRDEAGSGPAAFVIEWPDGRADHDPETCAQRVRDALNAALTAEADGAIDLLGGDL